MTAVVLVLTLTGCGPRAAGPSAEHDGSTKDAALPAPPSTGADRSAMTPAVRVATRFALAARSWAPASYWARYREQLRLSTGSLRRALRRAAPTDEQIAAYRADRAHSEATVVATSGLVQTASQARCELVLDERSVAAGQTVAARSTYGVELRQLGGRWRVAAFSVRP
jgi:hypothetical protein